MAKLSGFLLEALTKFFLMTVLTLWVYDLCEEDSFGKGLFGLMGYLGTVIIGCITALSVIVFFITRLRKLLARSK